MFGSIFRMDFERCSSIEHIIPKCVFEFLSAVKSFVGMGGMGETNDPEGHWTAKVSLGANEPYAMAAA